jgi:hypothetical protein
MNALSVINLMPCTKAEIEKFSVILKDEALNGYVNPLEFYVKLKAIIETCSRLIADDEIQTAAMKEHEKEGLKEVCVLGSKVMIRENGTRYDFTGCNDPIWEDCKTLADTATKTLKDREAFLKTIRPGMKVADAETGELLSAPVKLSKTGIVVTF